MALISKGMDGLKFTNRSPSLLSTNVFRRVWNGRRAADANCVRVVVVVSVFGDVYSWHTLCFTVHVDRSGVGATIVLVHTLSCLPS